jgi:outer membrane protein TolC
VTAARLRVELAQRGVTDVWLQFLPSLSLSSRVGFNSQVSYGPKTTWDVQAMLSVPFYDGGARYARLADAKGAELQAHAQLVDMRLKALVEVTQAQRASSVAAQSLNIAERARDVARRLDQNTRLAYQDGLGTSFELVNTAQALREAELGTVQAQFELARARALAALANADCDY